MSHDLLIAVMKVMGDSTVKGTVIENSDFSLVDLVAGVWSWCNELHILLIFKSVMSCPRLHF